MLSIIPPLLQAIKFVPPLLGEVGGGNSLSPLRESQFSRYHDKEEVTTHNTIFGGRSKKMGSEESVDNKFLPFKFKFRKYKKGILGISMCFNIKGQLRVFFVFISPFPLQNLEEVFPEEGGGCRKINKRDAQYVIPTNFLPFFPAGNWESFSSFIIFSVQKNGVGKSRYVCAATEGNEGCLLGVAE